MSTALDSLISAWRQVETGTPPFQLSSDADVLASADTVTHGYEEYSADRFIFDSDTRLHLGLVPLPYGGDLRSAKVFVLMLNPGLGPSDYYAEQTSSEWRDLLVHNLYQNDPSIGFPFLDQRFAWACSYWLGKLKGLIWELREQTGSFQAAIDTLRRNLAVLDLVPYHSPSFGVPWQVVDGLASSRLMRAAVAELTQRAHAGEILVIVTRGERFWGIEDGPRTTVYTAGEARAASLSATSRGGKAILEFLRPSLSGT